MNPIFNNVNSHRGLELSARKNSTAILILARIFLAACLACAFVVCSHANEPANPAAEAAQPNYQQPVLIEFRGPIDRFQNQLFQRKLQAAKRMKADLVVIEIDSPGGTVDDSLEISETLSEVDWAHTVAYVPDKAVSGAALASLGCDEIIMRPQSRIGDAGVIVLEEDFLFHYADAKYISYVVSHARVLAESKGRSPELVEAMIDKDVLLFKKVGADGKLEFATRRVEELQRQKDNVAGNDLKVVLDPNVWTLVSASDENKFLIINGKEAVELGFAQGNVASRAELAERYQLTGEFTVLKKNTADVLSYWLNRPLITVLILAIAVIALLVELSAPGISVGGIISALCFAMFFWARFFAGTAGALELVLFALGVAFLLMEIFVIPGFGITGILGFLLLVSSLILASQDFIIPTNSRQFSTFGTGLMSIVGAGALVLIGGAVITRYMGRLPILSSLVLAPPNPAESSGRHRESDKSKSELPKPEHFPNIGEWGIAESVLRPAGKANFGGETFDVVADGFVDPRQAVRVVDITGNVIRVSSEG